MARYYFQLQSVGQTLLTPGCMTLSWLYHGLNFHLQRDCGVQLPCEQQRAPKAFQLPVLESSAAP